MAKDDYYVIVYQILTYLYQCLKSGKEVAPNTQKEAVDGLLHGYTGTMEAITIGRREILHKRHTKFSIS